MIADQRVTSTSDPNFFRLCEALRDASTPECSLTPKDQELTPGIKEQNAVNPPDQHEFEWPVARLQACADAGVFEWFVSEEHGGQGWSGEEIIRGYLGLGAACLTTTFALTQLTGAVRRIANSGNETLISRLIPDLLAGKFFATLGISHLTTSRQHLKKPALRATALGEKGFVLNGYSPWATGAEYADYVVTGATLDDGRQLLAAVPTDLPGIEIPEAPRLLSLSGSRTGAVNFANVEIGAEYLMAGPVENVMKSGVGARTGGLQTSTLALALSTAAIEFVEEESHRRLELKDAAEQLRAELEESKTVLLMLAAGAETEMSPGEVRAKSNSLVLRATQSALVAAKGAGFVAGHPTGRWCREALFFLVWSCPQPVITANLCEFAGIG